MIRIYILVVITLLLHGCYSPKPPVLSEVNLFDYADSIRQSPKQYNDSPSVMGCFSERNKNLAISYFYYEIFTEIGKGSGCLFALPKHEYGIWKVQSEDCLYEDSAIESRRKQADDLLFSQRDTLIKYFDVYMFYVRQEELTAEDGGGYVEDDGTIIPDYYPKENATFYTYLYENGVWIEKAKENIKEDVPKAYGMRVITKILRHRFFNAKD